MAAKTKCGRVSVCVSGRTLEGRFKNGIKPGARDARLRLRMAGSNYSRLSIRRIASKRMRASTLRASRHRFWVHITRPAVVTDPNSANKYQKPLVKVKVRTYTWYSASSWIITSEALGYDTCSQVERLKNGNVHMCFSSRSGYRPFLTPPPALGN